MQLETFNREKEQARIAYINCENEQGKASLKRIHDKMSFVFSNTSYINYGYRLLLKKETSFIPNTVRPENQKCFIHRKNNL